MATPIRFKAEVGSFKVVWKERKSDLKQWLFYNIVLGLAPIWLFWIPLLLSLRIAKFTIPLLDGNVLVFAVTLCGASLGFFAEEARRELRETRRFLWNWMVVIMFLSVGGFVAISAEREFFPNIYYPWITGLASLLVAVSAIILNLHLAAIRMAYTDDNLVKAVMMQDPAELAKQANSATSVNGVKI